MQVFAKEIAELFTLDYPEEIKLDIACRLACEKMGASEVSIFMYSGKNDNLTCKGRYIDYLKGDVSIKTNLTLNKIVRNLCVYEYLYAVKDEFKESGKKKLFDEYKNNTFHNKKVSYEEFKELMTGFHEWERDYSEYKKEIGIENYEINPDSITGNFYYSLIMGDITFDSDARIINLEKVEPEKKKLCLTYLKKKLGVEFKAKYYMALPIYVDDRCFGVLRFLFPDKMKYFLSKNNSLSLDEEPGEKFRYLAQIMSLHLENNYFLSGYKKTYLSSRKPMTDAESPGKFLGEQCEALSEIIESRGAIIRRWNPQQKYYEIMGHSASLRKYVDIADSQGQEFFELITKKFDDDENILGIHYDLNDDPFKITKYVQYKSLDTQWYSAEEWNIPELAQHPVLEKLRDLFLFNIAIIKVPGITRCFIKFINTENRKFAKEDIKMIYPAIQNLGLEWKAYDYEKKKLEKRMEVISSLHEKTLSLFKDERRKMELKAFEYSKRFLEIVGETINEFDLFTNHLFWHHISDIVPEPYKVDGKYYLRNNTHGVTGILPFKNSKHIPPKYEIRNLIFTKADFSQKILEYFKHKEELTKLFDFELEDEYDYFDLPLYAESEAVNRHPVLMGIITFFYRREDDNIIKNPDFYKFMLFFSKQVSMAWKNLQENIAFKILEKIDDKTGADDSENHKSNSSTLDKIAEILAGELKCQLCCFMLADQQTHSLKIEGSNIPIPQTIGHRLSEKDVLSVRSFEKNQNFRIYGNDRILKIANKKKIRMIEEEIKKHVLDILNRERERERKGLFIYDNVCIEHWLSVVISAGKERLGLIKLFRVKGLKTEGPVKDDYYPPPFSEFEFNLLNRIQQHIFNIILSINAINKRMQDMRNVLHQVVAPLNALMGHSLNIVKGVIPEAKVPEKLEAIMVLSKTAANYARNFQKVLDIDTGNVKISRDKISNLQKYLKDCAGDYKPFVEGKKIQIYVTGNSKKDICLWADRELFNHVISNLLDNAVKYSLNAEERLKIGLKHTPEQPEDKGNILMTARECDGNVTIEVSNWGHSMDDKERKNVFDRAFRGRKARDLAPVGTGIGLYMVKKIVDLHQGTIFLEPATHENHFVFKIILPIGEKNG